MSQTRGAVYHADNEAASETFYGAVIVGSGISGSIIAKHIVNELRDNRSPAAVDTTAI